MIHTWRMSDIFQEHMIFGLRLEGCVCFKHRRRSSELREVQAASPECARWWAVTRRLPGVVKALAALQGAGGKVARM